jgi:multicomponent K+:H+ antiporter subunit D
MVLEAALEAGRAPWTWSVVLGATLLVVVALSRAGSAVFWRTAAGAARPATAVPRRGIAAAAGLLACIVGLVVGGGSVTAWAQATARQLAGPEAYREAVLGPAGVDRDLHRSLQ